MTLFQETVFTRGVNMMRCRFRYRCPLSHGFRRVSWNGVSDEPTQRSLQMQHNAIFIMQVVLHCCFVDVWSDENLGHIQPDTIEPSASWSQKHNNDIHPSMTELWARAQSSGKAFRISSNRLCDFHSAISAKPETYSNDCFGSISAVPLGLRAKLAESEKCFPGRPVWVTSMRTNARTDHACIVGKGHCPWQEVGEEISPTCHISHRFISIRTRGVLSWMFYALGFPGCIAFGWMWWGYFPQSVFGNSLNEKTLIFSKLI